MEENSSASESDALPGVLTDLQFFPPREPIEARHVNLGPSGPCLFTSDSIQNEVVSRRLGSAKLFCLGLVLTGIVALVPESFALAESAGLDQVRKTGKLRYG